jgi:hypothetical protein
MKALGPALGPALLALIILSGCSAVPPAATAGGQVPNSSSSPQASAPATPTPTAEPGLGAQAPAPTSPMSQAEPELRTAVAQAQVLDEALELVKAGRLTDARAALHGDSGFEWRPSAEVAWAEEYDAVRAHAHGFLELFDADGPDAAEVDTWTTAVTGQLAQFRDAIGLQPIGKSTAEKPSR